MADTFNFDHVEQLEAGAVGQPGQRTFFVLVAIAEGWVRIWLEKEQLRALADGLDELLRRVDRKTETTDAPPRAETSVLPMLGEFHAARLAVGYDEDKAAVVLIAHSVENQAELPSLACRVSSAQANAMAAQAIAVCNAGRQICPMCEQPIDPAGHLCPRSNGHRSSGM